MLNLTSKGHDLLEQLETDPRQSAKPEPHTGQPRHVAIFNLLVSANGTAWETDQLMRMEVERFKELSGIEANAISLDRQDTLKMLEQAPALLMYERGVQSRNADVVRYGNLEDIRVGKIEILFRFNEEGRFTKSDIEEFADRLGIGIYELNRTHWAVKDGCIPRDLLARLLPTYDVVFTFAGENRAYVEQTAQYLRSQWVKVFYDEFEQASLWGKDLAEHFDLLYRRSGRYCLMFISKHYVEKMWTRHERRSALARALQERKEYILPARFDDSEVAGIPPTVGYISLANKPPIELAKIVLKKLGRPVPAD